jgi:two-component system, response regulator
MNPNGNAALHHVVLADDDPDDRLLVVEAFRAAAVDCPLTCVEDGAELMDFLHRRGRYADRAEPLPDLVLLDLNMPSTDGRCVLQAIRNDPVLRHIPVIVLTTSRSSEDVLEAYRIGCSAFITKPVSFTALVDMARTLQHYWFETVTLPGNTP